MRQYNFLLLAQLFNLALDRIKSIEDHEEQYRENSIVDLSMYYDDVIGVTKSPGQRDCEVVFWIDHANAPYIITKPLHRTQTLLGEENNGKVFSVKVVLNFELKRELLGFGSKIKVLRPRILVKQIKQQLQKAIDRYSVSEDNIGVLK